MTRRTIAALLLMFAAVLGALTARAETTPLRVFAAASLRDAFEAVGNAWTARSGGGVVFSFAASSALARQIEQGAPADVFASADLDWMDYLEQKGLIDPASRANILGNALVLIAPATDDRAFGLARGADLVGFLGDGRLAVGMVAAVPAGRYARQALIALGLWDGVEGKLAETDTVRRALALVARGEAAAGIVYATDASAEPKVRIIGVFPADSHEAIVYPVARVASSTNAAVPAFLAFLKSTEAAAIYRRFGFAVAE